MPHYCEPPFPKPWKTTFDLGVERLEEAGFKIAPQNAPDTYRINGGQILTRRQLMDFAASKGIFFDPPDERRIKPRIVPEHEIGWDAMRGRA